MTTTTTIITTVLSKGWDQGEIDNEPGDMGEQIGHEYGLTGNNASIPRRHFGRGLFYHIISFCSEANMMD
jgi:hypothetical protein